MGHDRNSDSDLLKRSRGPYQQGWSTASVTTASSLVFLLCAAFSMLIMKMQQPGCDRKPYNYSLLGSPLVLDDGSLLYNVVVVTDLDHDSKDDSKKNTWRSILKAGSITLKKDLKSASVIWDDGKEISLTSSIAAGGRSMELSDLAVFDARLLSVDDRTGIIYQIDGEKAIPWVFVDDGPGNVTKGFKAEWMTVKDEELWVGGLGKEWTTTEGVFVNYDPMWVKRISNEGAIRHVDWSGVYKKLRGAVGIHYPGYMIHESCQWSPIHRKWFFMPRRASNQKYTEAEDEKRGTNYVLIANEDFSTIEAKQITRAYGPRGFSAFQFFPETNDEIVAALKSEEKDGVPVGSYLTVFNVETGHILLDEQPLVGKYKYEGIAFV